MANTVRVALVRASPATILSDYAHLLDLIETPLGAGHRYSLRIAIDRRLPFPGSSAPAWQTAGVARSLHQRGYQPGSAWLSHLDPDDLHGHRTPLVNAGLTEGTASVTDRGDLQIMLAPLRRGPLQPFAGTTRLRVPQPHPTIAVLDGTMVGNGPVGAATDPEVGNLLLASRDPRAADIIGARLLGIEEPAHAMIEVVGDRTLLDQRWRPIPSHSRSAAARDSFDTWTFRDQLIYTSWIYHTGWGQLFRDYQRPKHSTGT